MQHARARRGLTGAVTLVVAAALAVVGCTPAPEPDPTSSPAPSPSTAPVAYSGPAMFIGDEIEAFLLTPDEITALLPDVSEVSEPIDGTEMYADGSGTQYDPEECIALYLEQQLRAVGARTVEWRIGDTDELGPGALRVVQLGSVGQAEERMDQLLSAAENCASFTSDGDSTFTDVATELRGDVRAMAGVLRTDATPYQWHAFYGYVQVGNVLVQLVHEFSGDTTFASDDVAKALADRAEEAHAALIEKLTAEPPVPAEPEKVGADVALADWPIVFGAVGPIALGDDAREAADRVPGAEVTQTTGESDLLHVGPPGSASTLRLRFDDEGAVESIDVGAQHFTDDERPDGALLPSAGDVRIGDPMSKAMAAFPEGSSMRIISAGIDLYMIADRDGQVIWFTTAIEPGGEAAAKIYSMTVENAALWTYYRL